MRENFESDGQYLPSRSSGFSGSVGMSPGEPETKTVDRLECNMKRRRFLQYGMLASLAGPAVTGQAEESRPPQKTSSDAAGPRLAESARETPIAGAYDVIVCGGGPAGIGSALAAARGGAKTLLLEANGCLGGMWTAGILPWILDHDQPGIMQEIKSKLEELGARCPVPTHAFAFDPEALKLLLERLCDEAKVDFLLHARTVATAKSSGRTVSHVITESKSGRQAWQGTVFVDCTGDGDVAALAGCGFDVGNDEGFMQPGSLHALVDGIRFEELKDYIRSSEDKRSASKERLLQLLRAQGVEPSYKSPSIFPIREDLFWVMLNHAYGVRFDDVRSITRQTVEARRELHALIAALRGVGGPWKDLRLVGTAEQLGIREARRIHGLYTVTVEDMLNGIEHNDAVCRVRFGFDVHMLALDKKHNHGKPAAKSKPYDIPARALIARDLDNLLMAGRCISGDFLAHSSYRVTGPAVLLGEAAGTIAGSAFSQRIHPKEVRFHRT